jgi:hypothetical protein
MPSGAYFASLLLQELRERNAAYAKQHALAHQFSYGEAPVVCYEPDGDKHGNFLPETYSAIRASASWLKRLAKVHTTARTVLPRNDRGFWAELDSCNSSDALLMNVFCCPGVFDDGRVLSMLGVDAIQTVAERRNTLDQHASAGDSLHSASQSQRDETFTVPVFGFRARVPLANDRFDRTEVDMRLGTLLVEAKLTEADFQSREREFVNAYRDFKDVFNRRDLPQTRERYLSYQLVRNVLAAYALDCSFCVLHDARRPDLRDAWYEVMRCVKLHDLRLRCKVLTWQELAEVLPRPLQSFLEEKYGIVAHL